MKIVVSACLLGKNCKYNGGNNYSPAVMDFLKGHEVIAVCPEQLGGLPTPRIPSERRGCQVINAEGADVTAEFTAGSEAALRIALEQGAELAVLQSRSPSCGFGKIYDGTFSKTLIDGNGTFAELLAAQGIPILGSEEFSVRSATDLN